MEMLFKSRKMLVMPCLLFLIIFFGVSCSSTTDKTTKNDEEGLLASVEAFNDAVHWENYRAAADWLLPADRELFWNLADLFQGKLRIMDFEVRDMSFDKDSASGSVILRFRYFYMDSPTLQTKILQQRWRFLEDQKRWSVVVHNLQSLLPDK